MKFIVLTTLLFASTSVWSANLPPTIAGVPPTTALVSQRYVFTPVAHDPEGRKLYFVIKNRPTWTTFSYSTGTIAGTPGSVHVGLYRDITIYVKDGVNTKALRPFSIAVLAPVNGSATLKWTPPTTNTDGSVLTNLAGYKILYGTSADELTQTISVNSPGMSTYIVDNLKLGSYYFAVRAINANGAESALSNIASKVIK